MATTPQELADKISAKAVELCAPLVLEMELKKWPAEFRKIMWEAVAAYANVRASES